MAKMGKVSCAVEKYVLVLLCLLYIGMGAPPPPHNGWIAKGLYLLEKMGAIFWQTQSSRHSLSPLSPPNKMAPFPVKQEKEDILTLPTRQPYPVCIMTAYCIMLLP